jgi:hypothetical protein
MRRSDYLELVFLKNSYKAIKKLITPVHVINTSAKGLYSSYVCTSEIAKPKARANKRKSILSRIFKFIFCEKWKYQSYQVDFEFHQIDHQLSSLYFFSVWKAFRKENILWLNSEKIKNKDSYQKIYPIKNSCQLKFFLILYSRGANP